MRRAYKALWIEETRRRAEAERALTSLRGHIHKTVPAGREVARELKRVLDEVPDATSLSLRAHEWLAFAAFAETIRLQTGGQWGVQTLGEYPEPFLEQSGCGNLMFQGHVVVRHEEDEEEP